MGILLLAEKTADGTVWPVVVVLSGSALVTVVPGWDSSSTDLYLGVLTIVTVEASPGVVVALLPDIGLKLGSIAEL